MVGFFQFFKSYRWAILTGLMVGTSYIPFPPWALFFCYVPLWLWASQSNLSLKTIFIGGWISQAILTLIGFPWIAYVSKEFGFMPWPAAILLLLLFASAVHLYIPLALVGSVWLSRTKKLSRCKMFALLAFLMVLGEIFWPSLFPWNLGYPFLWIKSPVVQTTDLWGFQTLSLFVYLTNGVVALLFSGSTIQKSLKWRLAISACLFWPALHIWGSFRKKDWDETDKTIKVLLVQANIGNFEKFAAEKGMGYQQQIVDQYFSLTRIGLKNYPEADLVLWPESAYPDFLNEFAFQRRYTRQLVSFAQEIKLPVLTGGYSSDPQD